MNSTRRTLRSALLLATLPAALLARQQSAPAQGAQRITIPNTELHTVHSKIVGVDYAIYVALPATYATSTATYPVQYATDANRSFGILAGILQMLTTPDQEIPEMVVISIGYPDQGMGEMLEWAVGRTRDLTPTSVGAEDRRWTTILSQAAGHDVSVHTGGAAAFLRFLREELIPWTEARYRVSHTDRRLAGYSYGGLFTLYALFNSPETFQRYFAGSPSIGYDGGVLFEYEAQSAARRHNLPVRLFMSAGGLESETMLQNMALMAKQLRSRNDPGLRLDTHVFEGETHRSCPGAALSRALRVLSAPVETSAPRQ